MKQTYQKTFWLAFTMFLTSTVYAESASQAVVKAYQNWCAAIAEAKGDPAGVVKYYAPNAILLPTLSSDILFNKKDGGKNEYFTELTGKHDIRCVPGKLITRMYGNEAINSGFYKFSYNDEKGQQKDVLARFTFVYHKINNHWMIVNHHSSVVPAHQ